MGGQVEYYRGVKEGEDEEMSFRCSTSEGMGDFSDSGCGGGVEVDTSHGG